MHIDDILSNQCLNALEQLLESACPADGSGINRRQILELSGLIPSLVDKGVLPEVVLKMRALEDSKSNPEITRFKDGKELPKDFPFPEQNLELNDKDHIEYCYEWWKAIERKLDAAADLVVMPVALGLTTKFISRRGANGGICRVVGSSTSPTKSKAKNTQEWSNVGLPEDFLQSLQNLLDKHIPKGSSQSLAAKVAVQILGLDPSFAPRISQAIKLGKINGFANVQNRGIIRVEFVKVKKTTAQTSTNSSSVDSEVESSFNSLSFDHENES